MPGKNSYMIIYLVGCYYYKRLGIRESIVDFNTDDGARQMHISHYLQITEFVVCDIYALVLGQLLERNIIVWKKECI